MARCGSVDSSRTIRAGSTPGRAGDRTFVVQRDLQTGRVLREIEPDNPGHHHRCYSNKATERYILGGRRGTEFIDLDSGEVLWNSWVRGVCKYGVMPSNGLVYAPPHACGCYTMVKTTGFFALAPRNLEDATMAARLRNPSQVPRTMRRSTKRRSRQQRPGRPIGMIAGGAARPTCRCPRPSRSSGRPRSEDV
jgi:hypothetical protein